jgi:hypothetical protein
MLNSRLCGDQETINKTDWRKAMIVRKHSSVKLAGLSKSLLSGFTRAEQVLKVRLKNKRAVQKTWRGMEKMHHFYVWIRIHDPNSERMLPQADC